VDEEGATSSVVDVGTLDFSLQHDHQVVGKVAGLREDLPNRRLLRRAIAHQRRELLVSELGDQQLGVLGGHHSSIGIEARGVPHVAFLSSQCCLGERGDHLVEHYVPGRRSIDQVWRALRDSLLDPVAPATIVLWISCCQQQ
jgi:hypothetical protein